MAEGDLTVKERLDRIDHKIDGLTAAVTELKVAGSSLSAKVATGASILAIMVSAIVGLQVWQGDQGQDRNRAELCSYIRVKDNAARQDEIASTRLIFHSFKELVNTPEKARIAYEQNRDHYDALQDAQPSFCPLYDVPPFPPLAEFK